MNRHSSNRNAYGAQHGFSLVEVLIALIVMSVVVYAARIGGVALAETAESD